jgi:hypothetical protein
LDLGGYLRENQSSEIAGELNRIDAVVQDFITDIEVQNLRKAQESVPFAREKYEADKVLEVSDKVSELKKTHKWFLDLASHSPAMREQLEHDISTIEYEIQVAEESEAELRQWKVEEISQGDITDPFNSLTLSLTSSILSAPYFSRASCADCSVLLKF